MGSIFSIFSSRSCRQNRVVDLPLKNHTARPEFCSTRNSNSFNNSPKPLIYAIIQHNQTQNQHDETHESAAASGSTDSTQIDFASSSTLNSLPASSRTSPETISFQLHPVHSSEFVTPIQTPIEFLSPIQSIRHLATSDSQQTSSPLNSAENQLSGLDRPSNPQLAANLLNSLFSSNNKYLPPATTHNSSSSQCHQSQSSKFQLSPRGHFNSTGPNPSLNRSLSLIPDEIYSMSHSPLDFLRDPTSIIAMRQVSKQQKRNSLGNIYSI